MEDDTIRSRPRLVAIVGGSGAGKTWLAQRLQERLGKTAALLSLDRFYRDQSHLSPGRRTRVNFDHPRAIDWALLERVLDRCQQGLPIEVPQYDFATHSRQGTGESWQPRDVVLVEGLWLLRRPSLRTLFAWRIFITCADDLALQRRIVRDAAERSRTEEAVRKQFAERVIPMGRRYVLPQVQWADRVVQAPVTEDVVADLAAQIRQTCPRPTPVR